MHELLALWNAWSGPITAFMGAAAGWYGRITASKMQVRRDRLDAGQQALQLVATMQAREAQLVATIGQYSNEIDQLRMRRWAIDEMFQEVHGQAIAARMMVHELERRLGLQETRFDPLPPFAVSSSSPPSLVVASGVEAREACDSGG